MIPNKITLISTRKEKGTLRIAQNQFAFDSAVAELLVSRPKRPKLVYRLDLNQLVVLESQRNTDEMMKVPMAMSANTKALN